jgi:protein-tyrosine phosphatase
LANAAEIAPGTNNVIRDVYQGLLFVGDAPSVRNPKLLYDHNIQAVVDVAANELPAQLPREFIYFHVPLLDGEGNAPALLSLAISSLVSLVRNEIPTVVACSAGMSRSPAIAAAAISILLSKPADDCLLELVETGPHDVSPPLWTQIKQVLLTA